MADEGKDVGPASFPGLVSIMTDEDHSSADKVGEGENGEVNEVHQEL